MIQDIAERYDNRYTPRPPRSGDRLLCFRENTLLVKLCEDGSVELPFCEEREATYLFSLNDVGYYLGTPPEAQAPWEYVSTRALRERKPDGRLFACAVGESLHRWYAGNRFCGACGSAMEPGSTERSLVCPSCGKTVYPKICPAVIVAVCDGDRLLLTKYRGRAFQQYALVAGFCEIGETVEQTVCREVSEETGLHIKNLRFYKSQPWVYTDSLLMGFFAELDGSDAIKMQEDELSLAAWFPRSEIPADHSAISLTGEMIEVFRSGFERK